MIRFGSLVAFWVVAAGFAMGQVANPSPKIRISLPSDVSSNKVEVRYALYGDFGASGGFVKHEANAQLIEFPASAEGKVANEAKLFVWAPGCQTETFDVKLQQFDEQLDYSCTPLPTVTLTGRITGGAIPSQRRAEIQVDYIAGWACEFFGFADCMVSQFLVGAAEIDADGGFTIELPDFSADPVSSCDKQVPAWSDMTSFCRGFVGGFRISVGEAGTGNLIALLKPESKELRLSTDLKFLPSYPQPTMFIPQKAE